jgi:Domain of unknown function (DUF1877)
MDAFLTRLPEDAGARIADPSVVRSAIAEAQGDPSRQLSLEEAWAGLHFTLTAEYPIPRQEAEKIGMSWNDESLENAIMGGKATTFQSSYGPARYLSPDLVAGISARLQQIDTEDFRSRYDAEGLEEEQIPPAGWDNKERLDGLIDAFEKLRNFYSEAANQHHGILIHFV